MRAAGVGPLFKGALRKRRVRIEKHRAFHAYCVGAARTGTQSISELFRDHYRAGHEVDSELTLEHCFDYLEGKISERAFRDFIKARDDALFLEMDSSTHNFYLVPALVEMFPDAKFLIPIREPRAWLNSYVDYGLNNRQRAGTSKVSPQRQRMARFRYGELYESYSEGEDVLKEFRMPSIEALLLYFQTHYQTLLRIIPEERRVIYDTATLGQSLPRISEFLRIPVSTLNSRRAHSHKSSGSHDVLTKLPASWLEARIEARCGDLIKEFSLG
jgi:hypothetical protein